MRTLALAFGLVAMAGTASASEASRLYREGRKAEKAGQVARAYLLYTEAAALEPNNTDYSLRAAALQSRAALQSKPLPPPDDPDAPAEPDVVIEPPPHFDSPTAKDWAEARKPLPPVELKAEPGRKDLDFRGDSKSLYQQVAKAYGLDCIFDYDYQATPSTHFVMEQADYREALHALQAVTASFVAPISNRMFLVAKDTPQKRKDLEPSVSVSIPLPEPATAQDLTGMIQAVQQSLALEKVAWDTQKNMVVIRDRISKVAAARALFNQLLYARPQVEIEVQFLEVSRSDILSYGLGLPRSFPILNLGSFLHNAYSIPSGVSWLGLFGGGASLFGVGLADVQLLANMTKSSASTLLDSSVRALDGQAATVHVGQKYPILTSGYFGQQIGTGVPGATGGTVINNGGAFGSGDGVVNYTVAANNSNAARTGVITVGGSTFTVTQAPAGGGTCTYSLSSTTLDADAAAATGTVNVATDSACAWTATSNDTWIVITDGATGTGNGTVSFSILANTDVSRVGTMTIAGQTFTVTQAASNSPCTYSIAPISSTFPYTGATGEATVFATAGCAWTATSPVDWIFIIAGAAGTGSGSVAFQVLPSAGETRTATLTIAGQPFLVTQTSASSFGCSYTLTPPSISAAAGGISGTVMVSAPTGCGWTASSDVSWITITSGGTVTSGGGITGGGLYTPPPSFTFEDLGFSLKVTPHIHGMEDVTLDVEAEFKLLAGAAVNGIPIVANRQLKSTVTLQEGETAVVAGMASASEARTISGIAGVATIPLAGRFLRQNTRNKDDQELLILIRPRLLSTPPTEVETREVWVGAEERPFIPL